MLFNFDSRRYLYVLDKKLHAIVISISDYRLPISLSPSLPPSLILANYGHQNFQINCAVIPREGSNINEAEVSIFCKKNLAAFKVPKRTFITNSLPKTATGKIQRRIVAEHFLAQISTAKVPKFGA